MGQAVEVIDKLAAVEEIKNLKARYFRCVDTFDLEGWLEVFTDDAETLYDSEVSRGDAQVQAARFSGLEEIRAYWTGNPGRLQSVHHGHTPEIEIISDVEAHGIWAMEDIVEFAEMLFHGYGHYYETYRKVGGEWRIAKLHLRRTRLSQVQKNRLNFQ